MPPPVNWPGSLRWIAVGLAALPAITFCSATVSADAVRWGSIGRDEGQATPLGPQSPSAPLPPAGPLAPGEQLSATGRRRPAGSRAASSTSGQTGTELREPRRSRTETPNPLPLETGTQRPLPSYDGREHPTTVGDVALWVPRIVLSPLYLVSEYVVRRPLGFLTTEAERHYLPQKLQSFFTWNDKRAGIVPHGLVDFGLRTSVGIYLFWDRFLARNNELRALGATGGLDWWRLDLTDRVEVAPRQWLVLQGVLNIRPDWVFHGLGPESPAGDKSRFRRDLYQGGVGYRVELGQTSRFESSLAVRDVSIDPNVGCCSDRTLGAALATGLFPPPPVLGGYTVLREGLSLELDSRAPRLPNTRQIGLDFRAPSGTGARLALRGAHFAGARKGGPGPDGSDALEWLDYGATVGGYVDLTGLQRTLGLELVVDFADPLRGHDIPFTELPSLGGYQPLRGFLPGRLVDRSAATARISYTWPVWSLFDGVIHYELGNVFGPHLEGIELPLMRSSYGIGLSASDRRDHNLEALVVCGTRTFRDGAGPEYLRLLFGTTTTF